MILCCGEALIDMLPCIATDGAPAFRPIPGGAVFNTAIALGRLEVPTGFYGGLSTDMFGQRLLERLEDSGVDCRLCTPVQRKTTLAFVRFAANGSAEYEFLDENTAARMLGENGVPELSGTVRALFVGGIALAQEPAGATMECLVAAAGDRPVMVDPNIRPAFIADAARFRNRLKRILARADIVKLSNEDLTWLMGSGDLLASARALLGEATRVVIVTRGGEGVDLLTHGFSFHQAAPRVSIVDTVGAGDAFNAGFLARLWGLGRLASRTALRGIGRDELHQAVAFGQRCAAFSVAGAGANPPTLRDLA